MKAVVQRVTSSSVSVDNIVIGKIKRGILVLLGIHESDSQNEVEWIVNKLLKLRIFDDEKNKMNLSVQDIKGEVLVISQFTLYGDVRKGTRPSYSEAAKPEIAISIYNTVLTGLNEKGVHVESGEFGAMMQVELINDGPVTIILEK